MNGHRISADFASPRMGRDRYQRREERKRKKELRRNRAKVDPARQRPGSTTAPEGGALPFEGLTIGAVEGLPGMARVAEKRLVGR